MLPVNGGMCGLGRDSEGKSLKTLLQVKANYFLITRKDSNVPLGDVSNNDSPQLHNLSSSATNPDMNKNIEINKKLRR